MVGRLDEKAVNEASGLAASRRFPGRLYHVNDSGNASAFMLSDETGGRLETILLTPPKLVDSEDLAVGPCDADGEADCLFIGDIGDNARKRQEIAVLVIRERKKFDSPMTPDLRLRLRYPDGAHDAESLAVDPRTGDIYILVKEFKLLASQGRSARLYRLAGDAWRNAGKGQILMLTPYGELDLPAMARAEGAAFSHVATAMDFSPDGRRLLVLTYDHAWELLWDPADGPPPPTAELQRRMIPLERLLGKETIAWLPDGEAFIFGKEFKPDQQPSVLIRRDCVRP